MRNSILRAGLIGLGSMGRKHARVLASLDGVDFVGVVDPCSIDRASNGVSVHATIASLIARGIDYAVVAVPTKFHAEVGLQLAESGICALIEKPIAHTVEAAWCLHEAFHTRGLIAGVGHIERYNPAFIGLRTRLEAGELGDVYKIATRRQSPFPRRVLDVGVVKDLAIHDIDITSWLMKSHHLSVSAWTDTRKGLQHEDAAWAAGRLADSTVFSHFASWLSPTTERTTVAVGATGCFTANALLPSLQFLPHRRQGNFTHGHSITGSPVTGVRQYPILMRDPLQSEHENFRNAVLGKTAEIVPLEEGIRALRVAHAIIASGEVGKPVLLHGGGPAVKPVQDNLLAVEEWK